MKRVLLVAVLAMACGGSEADPAACGMSRSTAWNGSTATVRLYDATGTMAAWCLVPDGAPLQASCADSTGVAVSVPASCVENLPLDAPPHG